MGEGLGPLGGGAEIGAFIPWLRKYNATQHKIQNTNYKTQTTKHKLQNTQNTQNTQMQNTQIKKYKMSSPGRGRQDWGIYPLINQQVHQQKLQTLYKTNYKTNYCIVFFTWSPVHFNMNQYGVN